MSAQPPLRGAVAARLRGLADRLAPHPSRQPLRAPAPLIRLGGHWWYRGELVIPPTTPEEAAPDVQLRP